jgi:hypothetical protein
MASVFEAIPRAGEAVGCQFYERGEVMRAVPIGTAAARHWFVDRRWKKARAGGARPKAGGTGEAGPDTCEKREKKNRLRSNEPIKDFGTK